MRNLYYFIVSIALLSGCKGKVSDFQEKKHLPSHVYRYIDADTAKLTYLETDYVPVYSDIYHQDGTRKFLLTATVSVRNTSPADSAIILSVTYFDSYGKRLKEYVGKPLVLSPLESIEFVVEEEENLGGAGANFIVSWGATNYSDQLLIQSVMIGSYGQQGISFLSESRMIKRSFKK